MEVEDRGSLAAVADALGYTPSAVSQQLAKLEAETGRRLLEPVGRGVLLTEPGRVLVRHGRGVLQRLEAAEAALEHGDEPAGRLRVAAFQTAAQALVVPAFVGLVERYPELHCELHDQEAEAALPLLQAGELDVVVAEEYGHAPRPRDARLVRHDLGSDELLLALRAGHPLAQGREPIALADLAEERWATPWAGTAYANMVTRACRAAGFEPDIRHRVTDLGTLLDLARGGLAVALVPALGRPQESTGIAVRPLAGRGLQRSLFAATRRSSEGRPGQAAFLAELRRRVEPG